MSKLARSILSLGCFVTMIIGVLGVIGWANVPNVFNGVASGWCLATGIAFLGLPIKSRVKNAER